MLQGAAASDHTRQSTAVGMRMRCVRPFCACGLNGPLQEFTVEEVLVRVALMNGLMTGGLECSFGFCALVRVLGRALAVCGPCRMAVLLSTPMSYQGSVFKMSFLYMVALVHRYGHHREHVQQLLAMVQGLALCPSVGSTIRGIQRRSIVHAIRGHDGHDGWDTCSLVSRVLEGLGAYPLCGCSLRDCWRRDNAVIRTGLVGRWHRWHARGARRRWVADCTAGLW
jgi:hypothetical protein